jgi:alanine racemase
MTFTRPIWAEISRSRLVHNFRLLRSLAGPSVELLAVVKANAYGHGAAECASILAAEGASWFGVTCVEDAIILRRSSPAARILAMSGLWRGEADAVLEHRITPAVWEPLHLDLLEAAARSRRLGPATVPVHLEIDTGMSRQGVQLASLPLLLDCLTPQSPLRVEALMTHFHSAESPQATQGQVWQFSAAVELAISCGVRPEILSAGSSASLLQKDTDAVTELAARIGARRMLRSGIALYGYSPLSPQPPALHDALQPVLAWKTRVISLRTIEPGETAGYDATFQAQRPTRLALLPVGYADGLNRLLSSCGCVLLRGRSAPIAGRVSMDQTIVDVTEIPETALGDEAVLIGDQGSERITAAAVAQLTGTIPYEVLCGIAARVPRMMVD